MADYTNYPRMVVEDCELELLRQNVPLWFIQGFDIAEEGISNEWGRAEFPAYKWPMPIVKSSDGYHVPFDIYPSMTPVQREMLELAAVARHWVKIFGERSPLELDLACQFSRLDAMRVARRTKEHKAGEHGRKSGESRREANAERDLAMVEHARKLLETGTPAMNLVGKLIESGKYKNPRTGKSLTRPAITTVLKRYGIQLKKK